MDFLKAALGIGGDIYNRLFSAPKQQNAKTAVPVPKIQQSQPKVSIQELLSKSKQAIYDAPTNLANTVKQASDRFVSNAVEASKSSNPVLSFMPKKILSAGDAMAKYMDPVRTPTLLSRDGLNSYTDAVVKTTDPVMDVALAPRAGAKTIIGSGVLGGLFNTGSKIVSNALNSKETNVATPKALKDLFSGTLDAFSQGSQQGVVQAPKIGAISQITNPLIEKQAGVVLAKFPNLSTKGAEIINRIIQGTLSVPEGYAMAKSTGQDYNLTNAAIDFAVGSGLAKKTGTKAVDTYRNGMFDSNGEAGFVRTKDFQAEGDSILKAIEDNIDKVSDPQKNPKNAIDDFAALNDIKERLAQNKELPNDIQTAQEILYRNGVDVGVQAPKLSPLHQEALKYKTPEEFIKAKPKLTVFDTNPDGTVRSGHIKLADGKLSFEIVDGVMTIENIEAKTKRKGTGTKLMQEAEEMASRNGVYRIELGALPQDESISSDRLTSFYKSLGYRVDSSSDIGDQTYNEMSKSINERPGEYLANDEKKLLDIYNQAHSHAKMQKYNPAGQGGYVKLDEPILATKPANQPSPIDNIPQPKPQASEQVTQPIPTNQKTRGFVESVKETANPNVSDPLKAQTQGTYVPKPNELLMGEAKALLSSGAKIDWKNVKDVDQKVAATIQEAINLDKSGDHESAASLFNNLAEQGTALGRGVQAFSLLSKMSPEAISISVARKIQRYNETATKKIPELSGDQVQEIVDAMQKIDTLQGREKNIAIHELQTKMNEYIPSSLVDKALTVWKAGLLTSLRTHERNIVGNTIMSASEAVKDIPASIADMIMATKTGKRSMTPTLGGVVDGAKKGMKSTIDVMTTGYDPEEVINKFDLNKVTWGKDPVQQGLKKYTDAVFNSLSGEDKVFWNTAYARSLYDQAATEAINAGKQGDKQLIKSMVENPTPEMLGTATQDANFATFKDENIITNVASAVKGKLKGWKVGNVEVGKIIAEVLMPFTGVPSSVAQKTIAYSPIGLAQGIARAGKVMLEDLPQLQRQASQEIGRGVMGTGLFGLGAYLMSQGLMTGQPKDQAERDLWQMQNKQPNSVYVGGQWRSINSVGPQTLAVLAGAKLKEALDSAENGLGSYLASLGKDQLNQTFLAGVQQPLAAINEPSRYGNSYVGNMLGSAIPNIVKDTAKSMDSSQREQKGPLDYVTGSLPIARNSLTEKRDVMGKVVPQEPTGLSAFVDLFNSKTPFSDTVTQELQRLQDVGVEATPSRVQAKQTYMKDKVSLTPDQQNELEIKSGEALQPRLEALVQSDTYAKLTDDQKAKAIDNLVRDTRTKIRNTTLEDILDTGATTTPKDSTQGSSEPQKVYSYVDENGAYKELDVTKVVSMPTKSRYEKTLKQKASFKLVDDILEKLPEESKAGALKELGIGEDVATYYNIARQVDEAKSSYLLDKNDQMDHAAFIDELIKGRVEVNGKMVASNGAIDDLYDAEIISSEERKYLKKLKFQIETSQSLKPKESGTSIGTGGGAGGSKAAKKFKTTAQDTFKMSAPPQIDTLIKGSKTQLPRQTVPQQSTNPTLSKISIPKAEVPKIADLISKIKTGTNVTKAKLLVQNTRGDKVAASKAKLATSSFRQKKT